MNISVFLGSNKGKDPAFEAQTRALGEWIAKNGHTLVYGASDIGLMHVLADAVFKNGGAIIGLQPKILHDLETPYPHISELIVTDTLAERRTKLLETGDLFVALPGGLGTLDEVTEAVETMAIGMHDKRCVFLNVNGYYDLLRAFLDEGVTQGFIAQRDRERILFADTVERMARML